MQHRIVTFGNQAMNLGHAIASDLSLAGQAVTVLDMPENMEKLRLIKKQGGINVTGNTAALTSGKTGFAKIDLCTADPEEALHDADLIFVDAPADEFEKWIIHIAPYIRDGAVLHFNYYGYWPSLRVYPILMKSGKKNVAVTECPSSLYYARGERGNLDFALMKHGIPLSVFPANRTDEIFKILNSLYPTFVKARNVLEINFMNLNMIWHASIALLNVAYFDRVKSGGGDKANFYGTGITEHTGLLAEAQDRERKPVCEAYGIPYRPLMDLINQFSEGHGNTISEAQGSAKFVKGSAPHPVDMWERWLTWDIPLAMVPFISLAEQAGVKMPIHKGLTYVFGAILEKDFWTDGLTLDRLGLRDKSPEEIIKYVTEG